MQIDWVDGKIASPWDKSRPENGIYYWLIVRAGSADDRFKQAANFLYIPSE